MAFILKLDKVLSDTAGNDYPTAYVVMGDAITLRRMDKTAEFYLRFFKDKNAFLIGKDSFTEVKVTVVYSDFSTLEAELEKAYLLLLAETDDKGNPIYPSFEVEP